MTWTTEPVIALLQKHSTAFLEVTGDERQHYLDKTVALIDNLLTDDETNLVEVSRMAHPIAIPDHSFLAGVQLVQYQCQKILRSRGA